MFMDYSFMIYSTRWRCISMCSKRLIYFNVPTCLKLLFAASAMNLLFSCFFFSFYSPYDMLASNCPINSFKISHGETGIADYYNIILLRLNLEVHVFHCSRGGSLVALVGVWIVWNLEPLASGGQSSHKLIPHIICQLLCACEKRLN